MKIMPPRDGVDALKAGVQRTRGLGVQASGCTLQGGAGVCRCDPPAASVRRLPPPPGGRPASRVRRDSRYNCSAFAPVRAL